MSKIEMRITRPDKDKPEVSTVIEATIQHEWMADAHAQDAIKMLSEQFQEILAQEKATQEATE